MRATIIAKKAWQRGCPVPLADLVAVHVSYIGFDAHSHTGIIVVHKRVARDVVHIFRDLAQARFPVRRIATWENYGPNVYAERDITVGFYCEKADDAPKEWSSHAYGLAIDINPLENPFLNAHGIWWPASAATNGPRDRGRGKITSQSDALRIFARYGWTWGGFYVGERDFMHFTKLTIGGTGDPLARPYVVNSLQYVPGGAYEAAEPTARAHR